MTIQKGHRGGDEDIYHVQHPILWPLYCNPPWRSLTPTLRRKAQGTGLVSDPHCWWDKGFKSFREHDVHTVATIKVNTCQSSSEGTHIWRWNQLFHHSSEFSSSWPLINQLVSCATKQTEIPHPRFMANECPSKYLSIECLSPGIVEPDNDPVWIQSRWGMRGIKREYSKTYGLYRTSWSVCDTRQ